MIYSITGFEQLKDRLECEKKLDVVFDLLVKKHDRYEGATLQEIAAIRSMVEQYGNKVIWHKTRTISISCTGPQKNGFMIEYTDRDLATVAGRERQGTEGR